MGTNGGKYNLERAAAALDRAGVSPECSACGHDQWFRDPDPVVLPVSPVPGEVSRIEGMPAFAFSCARCGFVRLHSVGALLDAS